MSEANSFAAATLPTPAENQRAQRAALEVT
jgi:hypothetical protein